MFRLGATALCDGQQPLACSLFTEIHQVGVNNGSQNSSRLTRLNSNRNKRSIRTRRILDQGGTPFGLRESSVQIMLRQDRDCFVSLGCSGLHFKNEVAARRKIPMLKERGITGFFELVGNPLSPCAIG